jgi:hypothetical protein
MKYAEDMRAGDNSELVTRVLERRVEVVVPEGFAARVVAGLPPARKPREAMRVGRAAGLVAGLVLAAAMFGLAPHAAPSFADWVFDFELVAIAQLGGIAYWLTVRRGV